VYHAHISHTDAAPNHFTNDLNAYLIPDPEYRHFMADGDMKNEDPDEYGFHDHATMENEWERGGIPKFAYPSRGDRSTMWGPLIFDCGHGGLEGPDGEDVFQTELHPVAGWVIYRRTADADGTPDTPEKRTQSWVWYGPGDSRGIGTSIETTGGTLATPVQTTVADAFFSSWGGDVPESLNGCDSDDDDCTQDNEWRQNILMQDYTFFVPAPPKPLADPVAGEPTMIWESEDHCSEVPSSPGNPPGDDIDEAGEADVVSDPTATDLTVGAPACTIPDSVTTATDANGAPGIEVTVLAHSSGVTFDANDYVAFAHRYKVGWDYIPSDADGVHTYNVHFDKVRVWRSGDDGDAEWRMSVRANEQWIEPVEGYGEDEGDGPLKFYEESAIDDNDMDCEGSDGDCNDYTIDASVNVNVVAGEPINVWSRVFETDEPPVDPNDLLPETDSDRFGPGSYSSGLVENDDGAYELFYTITDVTKPPPTLGSLTVGTPQYGPNTDTGDVVRVSGSTPITLEGSDAAKLEYRSAPSGEPLPSAWQFDTTSPFDVSLAGNPDGKVAIQYAEVSADDIVAERRTTVLELDTTPPVLDLPEDVTVYADQTGGKTVTYVATATDNLPPVATPVSCDYPSGSLFPNGKNAPLTTTVTCTATDKVDNTSTGTFDVTVVSPFGYIPDFVVLGREWASLASGVVVQSGNVGAFAPSAGVPGHAGFEVVAGPSASLQGGPQIAAESDLIESFTTAGDVFYVDQLSAAAGAVLVPKVGYVPLFYSMPAVPVFGAGGADVTLSGTQTLAAGSYGKLTVSPNAVVTLTGGAYSFASIEVKAGAQVRFSAPSTLQVVGRVLIGNNAQFAPTSSSGVEAHDVVLYATGSDGPPNKPASAIAAGSYAVLALNAYAPNGTLSLGSFTMATGAFVGARVAVAANVTLSEDSVFLCP